MSETKAQNLKSFEEQLNCEPPHPGGGLSCVSVLMVLDVVVWGKLALGEGPYPGAGPWVGPTGKHLVAELNSPPSKDTALLLG